MKTVLTWSGAMKFDALAEGIRVPMDAKPPIGKGEAQTPKELVAAGMGGCTAMDVVALLKKHKQILDSLQVEVDIETSRGSHPMVFTKGVVTFIATGAIESKILLESVHLSQTKFCGVSAMLSKAFPIEYVVRLNGEEIGRGDANFEGGVQ